MGKRSRRRHQPQLPAGPPGAQTRPPPPAPAPAAPERSLLEAIAAGDLDDPTAAVCLHRPVGRFHTGEIRCPPLALDKLAKAS